MPEQPPNQVVIPFPAGREDALQEGEIAPLRVQDRATGPLSLSLSLGDYPFHSNPEEFALDAKGLELKTPITAAKEKARAARFAKGPIPVEWWKACHRANPNALPLVLGLLMRTGRSIVDYGQRWVTVGEAFGQDIGLSRDQRRRAIARLEAARLVEVERKPNHAPRLRLVSWKM